MTEQQSYIEMLQNKLAKMQSDFAATPEPPPHIGWTAEYHGLQRRIDVTKYELWIATAAPHEQAQS